MANGPSFEANPSTAKLVWLTQRMAGPPERSSGAARALRTLEDAVFCRGGGAGKNARHLPRPPRGSRVP